MEPDDAVEQQLPRRWLTGQSSGTFGMMRSRCSGWLWVAVLVAVVTSCSSARDVDATAGPTSSAAPPADVGPDVGVLGFGSLEGQDVVVWFWAEW